MLPSPLPIFSHPELCGWNHSELGKGDRNPVDDYTTQHNNTVALRDKRLKRKAAIADKRWNGCWAVKTTVLGITFGAMVKLTIQKERKDKSKNLGTTTS